VNDRVIFIRVGWMSYYDGLKREPEGPIGGGRFNETGAGSEVENFKNRAGTCRGYAQISRAAGGFNLDRIAGKSVSGDRLPGVLVVSVAKWPIGGQMVVGWHANATVFRDAPKRPGRAYAQYNFEAPYPQAVLLPEHLRRWPVPKGKSGMGQSNVLYLNDSAERPRRHRWIQSILKQVADYRGNRRGELDPVLEEEEGRRFREETDRLVRDPSLVIACLKRDEFRCRHCGFRIEAAQFRKVSLAQSRILHAHHVRPLADGRRKTRLNSLITLCPNCHAIAHALARSVDAKTVDLALLRRFYPQ
jgi:5-methylcytosine-specific restriction endonuclease McrA